MQQTQPPLKSSVVAPTELLHFHPSVVTADDGGQGLEAKGCDPGAAGTDTPSR